MFFRDQMFALSPYPEVEALDLAPVCGGRESREKIE